MFLLSGQVLASAEGMYIHTDGLGSPVARTDKNGNLISRTRYEPYGATAAGATPTIGFAGHVNDPDTGLIYMQQRYYDPYAGRFLSTDPVLTDANTGGSFNRYIYANNNPYKYVDPDGRELVVATYGGKEVTDKINSQLKKVDATKTGHALIATIKQSPHTITIHPDIGTSSAEATNKANAENGKGSSGVITHDPDRSPTIKTTTGGTAKSPPEVVLAHELSHGVEIVAGKLATGGDSATNIKRSETEAIKTENKVREEMKLPARSSE